MVSSTIGSFCTEQKLWEKGVEGAFPLLCLIGGALFQGFGAHAVQGGKVGGRLAIFEKGSGISSQDGYFMTGGTLTRNIGKQFGLALIVFSFLPVSTSGFVLYKIHPTLCGMLIGMLGRKLKRTRWMNVPE